MLWVFTLFLFVMGPVAHATDAPVDWESTLERVVPAVVSIRVTGTRNFDTEQARSGSGTGFVIDAEQGLILTNRHMVHAGPVVAEALFQNHEEVELRAVYRDPVHDFGVFRFDPAQVRYMPVSQLNLEPQVARVGLDIRVVGNDSGEKVSILDGTLARLDRKAPNYGSNTYNDFNTFYYQAASNTSGGSSGSPVVHAGGGVVALNAGGNMGTASSFYLPLHRVVRAIGYLKQGLVPPRGTLQTVFVYTAFQELTRLGLRSDTEAALRAAFPEGTGVLRVDEVVPGGPAQGKLLPGDVITGLNGSLLHDFYQLEAVLDDHVGQSVVLDVERGGEPLSVSIVVDDLHAITPNRFVEFSRGVLNTTSYQQARNHARPVAGVYVAQPGYALSNAGIPKGAILTHLGGAPIATLDDLVAKLETKPHNERVRVRWSMIGDPYHASESVVQVDRTWFPMRTCERDDTTGQWPCTVAAEPQAAPDLRPATVTRARAATRPGRALAPSLVMVGFDIPYPTAGMKDPNFQGTGVVIDAEHGLVLTDRDTVPVGLGDLTLTFAGQVRIPGRVVYLHPVHNMAVVRYDPALLGATPVKAASFVDRPVQPGDTVWQLGLDRNYQLVEYKTSVSRSFPLLMRPGNTPRFRDSNVQGLELSDAMPSLGGVLATPGGKVLAGWFSFVDQAADDRGFYGLPSAYIAPLVHAVREGKPVVIHTLGAEFWPIDLAEARDRGLSEARAAQVLDHNPSKPAVFEIQQLGGAAPARGLLREGDLVLDIEGTPITQLIDVERQLNKPVVSMTILRDGGEHTVQVPTLTPDMFGVNQVLCWAGLVLHDPHYEVQAQRGTATKGVYVSWLWFGSPASSYGLRPARHITHVNGNPTPNLEAFIQATKHLKDRQAVRMRVESLDGQVSMQTLKLDVLYWPTEYIEHTRAGWSRRTLSE